MDEDYTNDRAEYIEVRIDRVEDRVTSLEQQIITRSFDPQWGMEKALSRIANLERTVYNCTPDAVKGPITQKDVDRWLAIEKAAKAVSGAWREGVVGGSAWAAVKDELNAALMGLRS